MSSINDDLSPDLGRVMQALPKFEAPLSPNRHRMSYSVALS